jgi:carbonic anhydrase
MRSAAAVFHRLVAGNRRFAAGAMTVRPEDLAEMGREHRPDAAVLCCSDARIAPSAMFDTPVGELFKVRIAGAFPSEVAMASLVFAVEVAKVSLVIVLSHDDCGAIAAAVDLDARHEPTPRGLAPVVDPVRKALSTADRHAEIHESVAEEWVHEIRRADSPLGPYVASGDVVVVGGVAPIGLGLVRWVDDGGLGTE